MGIISYNSCIIFHYKFFQSLQHRLAFCGKGRCCEMSPGWILALLFTSSVILGMWPFLCCWGSVGGERRRKVLEKQGRGKRSQSSEGREGGRQAGGRASWIPVPTRFVSAVSSSWLLLPKVPGTIRGRDTLCLHLTTFSALGSHDQ